MAKDTHLDKLGDVPLFSACSRKDLQRIAKASDEVEVLETFPETSHPPIRYPAAVLAGSGNADAAAFLAFLRSDHARRIFAKHGFGLAG